MEQEVVLTSEQVEQIRKEANTPGATYAEVALRWKVDRGHVAFIAKRRKK